MSARDAAAGLREPVDHFDQLAQLERAALGPHAGEPLRVCETARAASLRLQAEEPAAPERGMLARLLGGSRAEREHERRMDAWDEALDALEAETEAAMARWRASADPALLAAATADRDAAFRSLADSGLFDAELAAGTAAEPIGTMMVRSALAHD
ncbi:hypothetical protein [Agrococcus sediminis]|uniref:hypothetical protein n=1 Tax=Agrococcus sediminis TaxID=2599924 RepID=UPI003418DE35